ncbi:hypothetical protein K7J14_02085 [Treponema zuelzerae]|uniref:Uncharacterized protein n=1 Tax=Teretinema zuelzerae TaxID=156 RepID=A0AAE3JHA5_9SPIR|nr:hypothetical protein [Teretinema zuelzerae]MCD1653487.1 hypothetical protein [Teretinema zuelzerae]
MCWKCGAAIVADGVISRSMRCSACESDVRSCRNCAFYSPGSFHDCAERAEDGIVDKERANFCDSFSLNPAFKKPHVPLVKGTGEKAEKARDAFDSLFGS